MSTQPRRKLKQPVPVVTITPDTSFEAGRVLDDSMSFALATPQKVPAPLAMDLACSESTPALGCAR
jgi:hypothetical protein